MSGILITGMGMVGAQIVKNLNDEHGIKPVVLDINFQWQYLDTIISRDAFTPVEGSILDQELISKILDTHCIERIIHTAAVLPMRVGHDAHPGFFQVNTWGTSNLMFLAKNARIKKFVMFSTNGVYQFRQNTVNNPVKEDFPSGLTHHNSYGNSKVVVEYLLRELHEEGSFSGNIIRPGEIYGPVMSRTGDEPIYWKGMIDAAISGNEYILSNNPEHRLDWVYCKDVAELAVRLLLTDSTPHIEYNASYGKCMGIYELKDAIDILFPGNRVKLENCGVGGWNYPLDMTRAREDFGFVPKYDITAGIQDYVYWFRA